jgi:flavodoxin
MKKLVIYYSQANGNTKQIAQMISDKTGGDKLETPLDEIESWINQL